MLFEFAIYDSGGLWGHSIVKASNKRVARKRCRDELKGTTSLDEHFRVRLLGRIG